MSMREMSPAAPGLPGIVAFSIHHWRMTIGIMMFCVIGGLLAISRLPLASPPSLF